MGGNFVRRSQTKNSVPSTLVAPRDQEPEAILGRLRSIISELPATSEKLSHGAPTWWGGRKTFACFHDGHYDEGRPAVWIKAPDGAQEALIESNPERFYRPKYLGPSGWIGVRLDADSNWHEVRTLLVQGHRLVAPRSLSGALSG